jgi:4'-phosphopantetheinyl transferase
VVWTKPYHSPHIARSAAMLNPEPTDAGDFHIACIRDAMAAALVPRWATRADRSHAAVRRRPEASLHALAALRALLFATTRRADWVVARAASGKPSVMTADGRDGPSISLSHTHGCVAVAVAWSVEIGIDVECHRPRDFAALADQAFGPEEQREVVAGGLGAFYRIWTLREAMAKATGDGLALVLNRHDLADGVTGHRAVKRDRWALLHLRPEPGYSLGLAWFGGRSGMVPRRIHLVGETCDHDRRYGTRDLV